MNDSRNPKTGRWEMASMSIEDRFWERVLMVENCWTWLGAKTSNGYGKMSLSGKRAEHAHRVAYKLLRGPIPPGLELDHLCRNRLCVNPEHLEPVSRRENILRGQSPAAISARRDICPQGHPKDGVTVLKNGPRAGDKYRYCRECARTKARRAWERKRRIT